MNEPLLIDLRARRLPSSLGGKAANLRSLIDHGFRVPKTYVIPWEAYEHSLAGDQDLESSLRTELEQHLDPSKAYAVRSSASLEDSQERSFAGQFKTYLDVTGVGDIMIAVHTVWDSACSPAVQRYLERMPSEGNPVKMAVILQEMVSPRISGVAFSHNPMTGTSETVVEAVEGSGLQLVQEGVTPYRWIHKWGRWVAAPEDAPVPLSLIAEVVKGVAAISHSLKNPVDLEWVYDGKLLYWVQVREITSLKGFNIYSNRISREVLPGQIKPLVWSLNIPLVISQWIRLLTEMIGKNDLKPHDLAKQFHYYAYFNMGALGRIFSLAGFPSEGLEMMMGIVPKEAGRPAFRFRPSTLRLVPRMLWFFSKKWMLESDYKKVFPLLEQQMHSINPNPAVWNDQELIAEIDRLYEVLQKITWYNINVPILMNMYNSLLSRQLIKNGIRPDEVNITADLPEFGRYDPHLQLQELNRQWRALPEELRTQISHSSYTEFLSIPGIEAFQDQVEGFIRQFGHISDSGNDFSYRPWREQPDLILQLICQYEQRAPLEPFDPLQGVKKRGPLLKLFYGRTRRFRLHREHISYHFTYSHGLFRKYFQELGMRLVNRDIIDHWEDIFYLKWEQARLLIEQGDGSANPARTIVSECKSEMERSRTTELPSVIYGEQAPPIIRSSGESLRGTPTSPGYYSGRVCVVQGIQHFQKVKQGDILVIPYSDVGWTPLFARAGAVIAESGGILSHSAIVAREYRIPAVLSVEGATHRLKDGQVVTVDGYKGEIVLHNDG
jgi:phosphohistidine swiveling domain-containing protein